MARWAAPVAGQAAPVAGQAAPMAGQAAPMAGQAAPVAGGAAPVAGQVTPMAGGSAPVVGEAAPAAGEAAALAEPAVPPAGKVAPLRARAAALAGHPAGWLLLLAVEVLTALTASKIVFLPERPAASGGLQAPLQAVDSHSRWVGAASAIRQRLNVVHAGRRSSCCRSLFEVRRGLLLRL